MLSDIENIAVKYHKTAEHILYITTSVRGSLQICETFFSLKNVSLAKKKQRELITDWRMKSNKNMRYKLRKFYCPHELTYIFYSSSISLSGFQMIENFHTVTIKMGELI